MDSTAYYIIACSDDLSCPRGERIDDSIVYVTCASLDGAQREAAEHAPCAIRYAGLYDVGNGWQTREDAEAWLGDSR